jgi:hypothetical protein
MKYISAFIGLLLVLVLISLLLAWPVMMLWNGCLVGAIDGVQEIGWLQAWGLQFLFGILFKTTVTKKD